jgi:hypothetical protein
MNVSVLFATLFLILIVLGLYWLPSIVGYCRRAPNVISIVVVNALLGWTFVGWVIPLTMALRQGRPQARAGHRPSSDYATRNDPVPR